MTERRIRGLSVSPEQINDTACFRTHTGELIVRQQSCRAHLCEHRQPTRAFQIVKDAGHFSITTFDDLEDVQVALMKIPSVVIFDISDLGKHTLAEAFECDRMQALQNLPVRFFNLARHGSRTRLPGFTGNFIGGLRFMGALTGRRCGGIFIASLSHHPARFPVSPPSAGWSVGVRAKHAPGGTRRLRWASRCQRERILPPVGSDFCTVASR